MDNPVSITTAYGSINLSNKSMSVASFKVSPPFQRVTASTSGRVRQRSSQPATSGGHGGGFSQTISEFEEGTVILYQASKSRRGSLVSQGSIFLRLRKSAPLLQVIAKLPTGPEGVLGDSFTVFTGHADLLNADELRVLGIEVARKYRAAFMVEAEVGENFAIRELAQGTAPKPVLIAVATSTGVEIKATAAEPNRRIRLRGK